MLLPEEYSGNATEACDPLHLEMMKTFLLDKGRGQLTVEEWKTLARLLIDPAARDFFIENASRSLARDRSYTTHRWAVAAVALGSIEPEFAGVHDRTRAAEAMSAVYNACIADDPREMLRSAVFPSAHTIHEPGIRLRLRSLHAAARALRVMAGRERRRRISAAALRSHFLEIETLLISRHWFSPSRTLIEWFADNRSAAANTGFWRAIAEFSTPVDALDLQLSRGGLTEAE